MNLFKKIRSNHMIHTLVTLKGNARACTWTEPLWGIPNNLYLPYVTLYMTALGLEQCGAKDEDKYKQQGGHEV